MRGGSPSGRERALTFLRAEILDDPASEGVFLNEQHIADQVGVSRTPVREAILILASEGLLELVPQRGAFVPQIEDRDLQEIFELRGLLELHAADRAIGSALTDVVAMRRLIAEQQMVPADQPTAFMRLDRQFHQALIEVADNALVSRSYATLWDRHTRLGVRAMRNASFTRRPDILAEHGAIVDALERVDREGLTAAVRQHLDASARAIARA